MIAMAHSALVKVVILTVIALLLLIPLALLGGLVTERTNQRDAAVHSVAVGWGDRQWIGGPILAIPTTTGTAPTQTHDWYVLPERLELSAEVQVQESRRRLGLYNVPVYVAKIRARGEFDLPREIARLTRGDASLHLHLEQARLLLPVQDPRGLRDLVSATVEFQNFEPSGGFLIPVLAAPVNIKDDPSAAPRSFDLSFDLAGTQALQFLPLARIVHVQAHGNWPDPGFTDGYPVRPDGIGLERVLPATAGLGGAHRFPQRVCDRNCRALYAHECLSRGRVT